MGPGINNGMSRNGSNAGIPPLSSINTGFQGAPRPLLGGPGAPPMGGLGVPPLGGHGNMMSPPNMGPGGHNNRHMGGGAPNLGGNMPPAPKPGNMAQNAPQLMPNRGINQSGPNMGNLGPRGMGNALPGDPGNMGQGGPGNWPPNSPPGGSMGPGGPVGFPMRPNLGPMGPGIPNSVASPVNIQGPISMSGPMNGVPSLLPSK